MVIPNAVDSIPSAVTNKQLEFGLLHKFLLVPQLNSVGSEPELQKNGEKNGEIISLAVFPLNPHLKMV